jgi:hypothetical protein
VALEPSARAKILDPVEPAALVTVKLSLPFRVKAMSLLLVEIVAPPLYEACKLVVPETQVAIWLVLLRQRAVEVSALPRLPTVMMPEVLRVVIPLRAPALDTSKLVESMTRAEEPPPIVVVPVLLPVLMLTPLLELLLRLIRPPLMVVAAPEIVAPRAPWSRPAPASTPTAVTELAAETAPALVTLKLVELISLVKVPLRLIALVAVPLVLVRLSRLVVVPLLPFLAISSPLV